jgi:type II secretory pathway pseudopilin PulG
MTRTRHINTSGHRAHRGVVLLALLMALVLGGIALMAGADVAAVARQRAREQELLFVGDQYRKAILRYYVGGPAAGARRVLPAKLEDLLDDNRFPMPVHHLRRLYPDPITGGTEWGLLRVGDRITGVYSLSDKKPLKQAGFQPPYQQFEAKQAYSEWVFFVTVPGRILLNPPTTKSPAPSGASLDPQRTSQRSPS